MRAVVRHQDERFNARTLNARGERGRGRELEARRKRLERVRLLL